VSLTSARAALQRMNEASLACSAPPPPGTPPLIAEILGISAAQNYAAAAIDAGRELRAVLEELDEQRRYAVRYLAAYRSARQRADAVHQALVEADAERDYLRAQLRDRDEATR
jgi:hypothetical protein